MDSVIASTGSASPAVRLLAFANHRVPVPAAAVLNSVLVLESLERLFESVPRQVFVRIEEVEETGFEAVSPGVRVSIRAFRRICRIEISILGFKNI
jgi:hypothetical protein